MTLILDQFGRPFGGAATPFALPQPITFSSIFGGAQQTYFHGGYDQALERSREDALLMRNDCFLMGLLQERKLGTAGLRWHLEVDDERDPYQKMVRDHLENCARAVRHLPRDVFLPLMEGIWYGRAGVQATWKWQDKTPPPVTTPAVNGLPATSTPQGPLRTLTLDLKSPVNGDKIGHRYSGLPYVEVNVAEGTELQGAETIVTTQTRAMLLKGTWRDRFLLHVHSVEDPDYFDAKRGDMIYGVGIRSTIFWHDWLKREFLAELVDFLERYGMGLTLIRYDAANPASLAAAQKIAEDLNGRKMAILVPVVPGQESLKDSLYRVETPSHAAEVVLKLMALFDHYLRYYVLGDEGGGEGKSKGGDEVREMTSAKWKMYRLDALNLADTLTGDYLDLVKRWTFPWADFPVRWVFDVDSPDIGERIGAIQKLWEIGVGFDEDRMRGLVGEAKPAEGASVVSKERQMAFEAALKPAPDPNRTAAGTFGTKGGSAEGPPGQPEPPGNGQADGAPAQAEPAHFVRDYKPRPPSNPAFEEKHLREPAGNPDGGDWVDNPYGERTGRGRHTKGGGAGHLGSLETHGSEKAKRVQQQGERHRKRTEGRHGPAPGSPPAEEGGGEEQAPANVRGHVQSAVAKGPVAVADLHKSLPPEFGGAQLSEALEDMAARGEVTLSPDGKTVGPAPLPPVPPQQQPPPPASRPAAAPPHEVVMEEGGGDALRRVFGGKVSEKDVPALAGAPAGSKVRVGGAGETLHISFDGEGVRGRRALYAVEGELWCENAMLEVDVPLQGKGLGTKIFSDQVRALQRAGVRGIVTEAAGSAATVKVRLESGRPDLALNGYYTWPLLGYDGPIPAGVALPPGLAGAKTMLELYGLPGGAAWWKENGVKAELEFDLTPGSPSLAALEAYLKKRESRRAGPA